MLPVLFFFFCVNAADFFPQIATFSIKKKTGSYFSENNDLPNISEDVPSILGRCPEELLQLLFLHFLPELNVSTNIGSFTWTSVHFHTSYLSKYASAKAARAQILPLAGEISR